jgi:hypothetical protein
MTNLAPLPAWVVAGSRSPSLLAGLPHANAGLMQASCSSACCLTIPWKVGLPINCFGWRARRPTARQVPCLAECISGPRHIRQGNEKDTAPRQHTGGTPESAAGDVQIALAASKLGDSKRRSLTDCDGLANGKVGANKVGARGEVEARGALISIGFCDVCCSHTPSIEQRAEASGNALSALHTCPPALHDPHLNPLCL